MNALTATFALLSLVVASVAPAQDYRRAAVRLSPLENGQAASYATGTVIDARDGSALIATCAHVFRESGTQAPVLVDVYYPDPALVGGGRVLYADLASDVALVGIRAPGVKFITARVATQNVQPGESGVSIGCSRGGAPVAWHAPITAVNRYHGCNTSAGGVPGEGRSGGGLFNARGELVGILFAADPTDRGGIYAGLGAIHTALDQTNLRWVYRTDGTGSAAMGVPTQETGWRRPFQQQPRCVPGAPACRVTNQVQLIQPPPMRQLGPPPTYAEQPQAVQQPAVQQPAVEPGVAVQPPAGNPAPPTQPAVEPACRCGQAAGAKSCTCSEGEVSSLKQQVSLYEARILSLERSVAEARELYESGKLKGAKGDKGDKGAAGDKGDRGDPGEPGLVGPIGPVGPAPETKQPDESSQPDSRPWSYLIRPRTK